MLASRHESEVNYDASGWQSMSFIRNNLYSSSKCACASKCARFQAWDRGELRCQWLAINVELAHLDVAMTPSVTPTLLLITDCPRHEKPPHRMWCVFVLVDKNALWNYEITLKASPSWLLSTTLTTWLQSVLALLFRPPFVLPTRIKQYLYYSHFSF